MKIAIYMRNPPSSNSPRDDNLRGEARWERQVYEALREGGRFQVKGLHQLTSSEAQEYVLICHDFWETAVTKYNFKGIISNVFCTSTYRDNPNLLNKMKNNYGSRLVFTFGYNEKYHKDLLSSEIGAQHFEFLFVPGAPYIDESNHFNKKIYLFHRRLFIPTNDKPDPIFEWITGALERDSSKEFHIVSGYCSQEYTPAALKHKFLHSRSTECLRRVENRIVVHPSLSWCQVLDLYKNVKLVPFRVSLYGGPPLEAAMHGIPFIYCGPFGLNRGAFGELKEKPYIKSNYDEYLELLNRLDSDEEFYTKNAGLYRNYVKTHHTYEVFRSRVEQLMRERFM